MVRRYLTYILCGFGLIVALSASAEAQPTVAACALLCPVPTTVAAIDADRVGFHERSVVVYGVVSDLNPRTSRKGNR